MNDVPLAYRAESVPQIFPIGRSLLFKKIKSGEIESFTVGRARMIPREGLIRFMQEQIAETKNLQAGIASKNSEESA